MRITVADVRMSDLPEAVGLCAGDTPRIVQYINAATQRLINASGETGWAGGWQKVVFTVSVSNPYITLPRQFARAVNLAVCQTPITINNEWYEMLPGGPGLVDDLTAGDWCGDLEGYERGVVPTITDIASTNQRLRAYISDSRDVGLKMLITGLDNNGLQIYSTLGIDNVNGLPLTLASPFVDSNPTIITSITHVQKDITYGDVVLKSVDNTTGAEVTLSRYGPTEVNPAYRRYIITKLPSGCCSTASGTLSVTAMAKIEYVPVYLDTDQLLIGNIEALKEECQAIRYAKMDNKEALVLAAQHHGAAVRLLQNELRHTHGEQKPAIVVRRFANNDLRTHNVGNLI